MPGFDRTGPRGRGPMTGGGRGVCAASGVRPVWGLGRGYAAGRGRGIGWCRRWDYSNPSSGFAPDAGDAEIDFLQRQAQSLKARLQAVQSRIGRMKNVEE